MEMFDFFDFVDFLLRMFLFLSILTKFMDCVCFLRSPRTNLKINKTKNSRCEKSKNHQISGQSFVNSQKPAI